MSMHLIREVERLKRQILALGGTVEERLRMAVKSVEDRDAKLASKVIAADVEIDEKEVDVEEECLKILALHQPVASDLRFIIAVLKINNDIERIGDLAVSVAERTLLLVQKKKPESLVDFTRMADLAQEMLRKSLDALVNLNAGAARGVCADDDRLDQMNRDVYEIVKEGIGKEGSPDNISSMICLLSIARSLERIGDHATNIAEDVVYLVEGHIVRHHMDEGGRGSSSGRNVTA